MANPKSSDQYAFPWWYTWVKWVLPIALALAVSAWVGLTLTATIPAYGMLKWAPVLFASLEGFSAFAALSFAMGAMASLVGIIATVLTRALLSNVSENLAQRNIDRATSLTEKYEDVVKQLEELNKAKEQEREEADLALEQAGQRNEALVRQLGQDDGVAPEQPKPVPAANDGARGRKRVAR